MKMPTIHCMDNGKILCGKKKGLYADIKEFQKPPEKQIASIVLGGCSKCESIVKSREAVKNP